jgi:hypothetical protein
MGRRLAAVRISSRLGELLQEEITHMLHITCDYCHREILPGVHDRYIVKMEVYAADDANEITEADIDEDHLESVSELLSEANELSDPELAPPAYKRIRFDLCPDCHKKFLTNPLGREAAQKFDFSEN